MGNLLNSWMDKLFQQDGGRQSHLLMMSHFACGSSRHPRFSRTIPALVLTGLVLLAFAYTAWNRTPRGHLNRVSFRLLVYAMIANLVLASTLFPGEHHPGPGCVFTAFAASTAIVFSACMFFCMSLNLQLVLVHGINGQMMEKYYLIGSFLFTGATNIPAVAAGQLGYNSMLDTCWFNNPDPATKLRWMLGSQLFWLLSMSTSELVFFLLLVCFMIRHQRRTAHVHSNVSTMSLQRGPTPAPIVQYRGIILRIGLYPLLSCSLNFLGCISDLYLVNNTANTEPHWRVDLTSLCTYCLRPFLYACLAATDPSFLRAVGTLRRPSGQLPPTSLTGIVTGTQPASVLSASSRNKRFSTGTKALVHVELQRVTDGPQGDSGLEERLSVETQMMDLEQGGAEKRTGVQFSEGVNNGTKREVNNTDGIECQI
ncbi:hypothetical protein DFH07DRAFT_853116 [Mycena maculata]|uniref:G-protein coupled receptors family 2 profile 2 domain-containing protein n=1 Tax=Mycena maculata TaxID=230809 RepID=A0AAD7MPG5_9AGAR|nr:hypothetical protein DFH07DRAFT_853116 [Mycena maculata]